MDKIINKLNKSMRWLMLALCFSPLINVSVQASFSEKTTHHNLSALNSIAPYFEVNQGQFVDEIKFVSKRNDYSAYFYSNKMLVVPEISSKYSESISVQFYGGRDNAKVEGVGILDSRSNYFLDNNRDKWQVDVPHYSRIRVEQLYSGIDLVYYNNKGSLEYDFVVSPGASPKVIKFSFDGVEEVSITHDGSLSIQAGAGELVQNKPGVYQIINGHKKYIPGRYIKLKNNMIGFHLAGYDVSKPLVIDPVLEFSTYLGGTGNDDAFGMEVDEAGNLYVMGTTASTDFPVLSAYQNTSNGSLTIFVSKINTTGSPSLVYSTYYRERYCGSKGSGSG